MIGSCWVFRPKQVDRFPTRSFGNDRGALFFRRSLFTRLVAGQLQDRHGCTDEQKENDRPAGKHESLAATTLPSGAWVRRWFKVLEGDRLDQGHRHRRTRRDVSPGDGDSLAPPLRFGEGVGGRGLRGNFLAPPLRFGEGVGGRDRASTANPALPAITTIRQSIQQANSTLATIAEFLEQARAHRESGALVTPTGDNAAALYHQILSIDPVNSIAKQGLNEVVAQLRAMVAAQIRRGQFGNVAEIISQASSVNLDPAAIEEFRKQLITEQTRIGNLNRLLEEARSYIAEGFLTQPDGGNAALSLREVQRLDPANKEAERLLKQVAQRLARVAQEAKAANLHREAQEYLDLALAIVPGVTEWQTLRDEWSRALINER